MQRLVLFLVICSSFLVILRNNSIPVGSLWDDAHYIILAESLSNGTGYRLTNLPGAPVEDAFPPGYSLLLVPFVTLFPNSFVPLKMLNLVFWMGSLLLIYRLVARRQSPMFALTVLALTAFNPELVGMSTTIMSEPPFLFFSLVALNLLEMWETNERKRPLPQQALLLAAVLATALFSILVRTLGIALLAGILFYLLVKYGRRYVKYLIGVAVIGVLLFIPLAWFNAQNGGALFFSPLYFKHVNAVSQQFVAFTSSWQDAIGYALPPIAGAMIPVFDLDQVNALFGATLMQILMGSIVIAIIGGYLLSLRKFQAMDFYMLFYAGILYFWIVYTYELRGRHLLAILPFLYYYLLHLLHAVSTRIAVLRPYRVGLVGTAVITILLISTARNLHEWQNPASERIVDLTAGVDWIEQNTPEDAVIMSVNATPEHLYHRRPTAYAPGAFAILPDLDMQAYLEHNEVDYIIIRPHLHEHNNVSQSLDAFSEYQLLPFLLENPDQFQVVYRNDNANMTIYEVVSPTS